MMFLTSCHQARQLRIRAENSKKDGRMRSVAEAAIQSTNKAGGKDS